MNIKLSLSAIAPTLQIKGFVGGTKFVDKDNPVFEGGSDLAYILIVYSKKVLEKQLT